MAENKKKGEWGVRAYMNTQRVMKKKKKSFKGTHEEKKKCVSVVPRDNWWHEHQNYISAIDIPKKQKVLG